ncbi:MAG: methyltransferase domain-containing protein, partial [Planctomycetota bacterium]
LTEAPLGAKPMIDIGCGVGGTSFRLAGEFDSPVLGIDLHFPMLRLASGLTRESMLSYSRRRVGMVYDRRTFEVAFKNRERVDFWACDASCLPFPAGTFGNAVSMNLLDCVRSPMEFLHSLSSILSVGAHALVATPYDWSDSVTAPENWLGGHSQRGPLGGASEPVLRELLDPNSPHAIPGLEQVAETNQPWQVRLHDRSFVAYQSHLVAIKRVNPSVND